MSYEAVENLVKHLNLVYPEYDFFCNNIGTVCYRNDMPDHVMFFIMKEYNLFIMTRVHALAGMAKLIDDCFDPVRLN